MYVCSDPVSYAFLYETLHAFLGLTKKLFHWSGMFKRSEIYQQIEKNKVVYLSRIFKIQTFLNNFDETLMHNKIEIRVCTFKNRILYYLQSVWKSAKMSHLNFSPQKYYSIGGQLRPKEVIWDQWGFLRPKELIWDQWGFLRSLWTSEANEVFWGH